MEKSEQFNREKLVVLVAVLLAGILAAVSVRSVWKREKIQKEEDSEKLSSLKTELLELETREAELEAEIEDLNARYDECLNSVTEENEAYHYLVKRLREQNETYGFYAGMTEVSGSGIVVKIDDSVGENVLVHDATLLGIVQSLREAGASAISVNEERIVAMTEFICTGSSITVNGRKLFAPFTIKAIGGEDLYDNFLETEGYRTNINSKLKFDVNKNDNIDIKAYVDR